MNILFVDDDMMLLELVDEMLADLGHRTVTVSDASSAIRAVQRERFDLAFLDEFMGPWLGVDLMPNMAVQDPELPFVIVTGHRNSDLTTEALQRGAAGVLEKPFFLEDMVRVLSLYRGGRDQGHTGRASGWSEIRTV